VRRAPSRAPPPARPRDHARSGPDHDAPAPPLLDWPVVRRLLPLALLLAALVLGACGGGDEQEAATTAAPATTPAPAPADIDALAGAISTKLNSKPAIPAPSGEPPTELATRDIVKGKGRAARPGDDVSVQYVGVSWSTGQEFDASWDRGQPFGFPLGAGQVIPGWDQGVAGMRKGGRRLLVIPPDLGYGPTGSPPVIKPNETLVFVVDLERAGG
jgi:peptidylprolyl isomerase